MTATAGCTGQDALVCVDSYLAEVLAAIRPLAPRELDLDEADRAVLAEDVAACWPLPLFDNAAMDGYAVAARRLAAVQDALPGTDMLVSSGGVSMGGEHDTVKAALKKLGTVTFRKVALRPGMPQGYGVVGPSGVPILTLPGNPVSAYVSFRLFAVPAVRARQGLPPQGPGTVRAVLTTALRSPPVLPQRDPGPAGR